MVKPVTGKPAERDEFRFRGVRKRKWGKWVSEIRLPNSRERIWLGSYDSPVKAARAFDAALFCLRGRGAKFNFPENRPEIPGGRSLEPPQIQNAAARFANEEEPLSKQLRFSDEYSSSSSSSSPLPPLMSVSDEAVTGDDGSAPTIDWSFLDSFATEESGESGSDLSKLSGLHGLFDDFVLDFTVAPSIGFDYEENNNNGGGESFLWNF